MCSVSMVGVVRTERIEGEELCFFCSPLLREQARMGGVASRRLPFQKRVLKCRSRAATRPQKDEKSRETTFTGNPSVVSTPAAV